MVLISSLVVITTGVVAVWMVSPGMERWGVAFHQKRVMRSLAAWGIEDSRITNDASAIHAAEMVGYIGSYYVPGPGYRGPLKVEAALEKQRRESIERIVASLERYTGFDYGTNVERWTEWAEKRKSSEQDGAANRSQPIRTETNRTSVRAETNRTSSAAGSRR